MAEVSQEELAKMSPDQIQEMQKQNCIFCHIISGKVQSKKIYEDEKAIAILDINPANPGHTLIIPKAHYSILPQMPDEEIGLLFMIAKNISNILLKALKAEGTNIFVANGSFAGQKAPHFMIHVIPRMDKDGLMFELPQNNMSPADLGQIKSRLLPRIKEIFKLTKEEYEALLEDSGNVSQSGVSQGAVPARPADAADGASDASGLASRQSQATQPGNPVSQGQLSQSGNQAQPGNPVSQGQLSQSGHPIQPGFPSQPGYPARSGYPAQQGQFSQSGNLAPSGSPVLQGHQFSQQAASSGQAGLRAIGTPEAGSRSMMPQDRADRGPDRIDLDAITGVLNARPNQVTDRPQPPEDKKGILDRITGFLNPKRDMPQSAVPQMSRMQQMPQPQQNAQPRQNAQPQQNTQMQQMIQTQQIAQTQQIHTQPRQIQMPQAQQMSDIRMPDIQQKPQMQQIQSPQIHSSQMQAQQRNQFQADMQKSGVQLGRLPDMQEQPTDPSSGLDMNDLDDKQKKTEDKKRLSLDEISRLLKG